MKQRIRTVGIIKRGEDILLLKKPRGRSEEPPLWELPTGKIAFGEQPEEAMSRAIYEFLGVQVLDVQLADAVTFVGLAGASQLGNLYIVYEVDLDPSAKINASGKYTAYKYVKPSELNTLRLDEATISVLEIHQASSQTANNFRSAVNGATVYVDGGSRGNPGPAGVGYYIVGENGAVLGHGGEFIGFATSRVAEYYALKKGCTKALELGLKRVRFVSDSLMMVNQMNGVYQVKNRDLQPIYQSVQQMLTQFEAYAFVHVKREQNVEADREVNLAIDQHFGRAPGAGHIDA